jgi:hypothetical protein
VPVDVGEPQLSAWMGAFAADDDPHTLRPGGQIEQSEGPRVFRTAA